MTYRRHSSVGTDTKVPFTTFTGCIAFFSVFLTIIALFAMWTDRNLDFWVSYIKGEAVDVPYWLSLIVTIVGNGVIILANVIAEIARFAV